MYVCMYLYIDVYRHLILYKYIFSPNCYLFDILQEVLKVCRSLFID